MLSLWLLCVLVVISLPGAGFDGMPHWKNIEWVPFTHLSFHPEVMIETALNLVAFIPLGYLAIRSVSQTSRNPILAALLLGLCSSAGIEFYELFCHDRFPSTTDILMNVGGTGIGVWLAFTIDQMFTFFLPDARRLTD